MILRIFDYFQKNSLLRRLTLTLLTLLLLFSASRLTYKEDISEFLPLDSQGRESLEIYQDISGANQLVVIFDKPGSNDQVVNAIELFKHVLYVKDTLQLASQIFVRFDAEKMQNMTDFIYTNIPYFISEKDYHHLDSLFADSTYISSQLSHDKEMLMFPSGGVLSDNISRDPLNIFAPLMSNLQYSQKQLNFEAYDGCIFSTDMKHAIIIISSPFGNNETENNAKLIDLVQSCIDEMNISVPEVNVHMTGGPKIAVGNASQIKSDSILAVSLSVVLIILILYFAFRSVHNITLILVSIIWGLLFAIGAIALFRNEVSIIVIGISSIIIGIAVNYPLHLIAHTTHKESVREAVKEIVAPLLIGNVTTIGAFLALVPIKSIALSDLGLFASFLLLGTIIFVMIYLPHFVKKTEKQVEHKHLNDFVSKINIENSKYLAWGIVVLTIIFGIFSFNTKFDTDMTKINFMTDSVRADLEYLQTLQTNDTTSSKYEAVYVVSTGNTIDEALEKSNSLQSTIDSLQDTKVIQSHQSITHFVTSMSEQKHRLSLWKSFIERHRPELYHRLSVVADSMGFVDGAFNQFYQILEGNYPPRPYEYFSQMSSSVFSRNITNVTGKPTVVDNIMVTSENKDKVKAALPTSFDVSSMNNSLAVNISDNFNYIGWICSFIVFFFLWFSFGSIELAIISFLPMAVSWIWILGIMSIFGIHFNIVNIILATFIFGQGDDYTIFITEGCCHEYTYRRPMLTSYKSSIILSALIMFVGIGTLITARHPALLSLAQLTIIGMFSVVLMAYVIPPFIFNLLVKSHGQYRLRPLRLSTLIKRMLKKETTDEGDIKQLVLDRYLYKGAIIYHTVKTNLKKCDLDQLRTEYSSKIKQGEIDVEDNGYGETAILVAYLFPEVQIFARVANEDIRTLAKYSAEGVVNRNIIFIS